MIAIPQNLIESLINTKFKNEIDIFTRDARLSLIALKNRDSKKFNISEKTYLNSLIKNIDAIVIAPPAELKIYQKAIGLVPKRTRKKGTKSRPPISFKDKILTAMGYKTLRSVFYPKYFQQIGIKSCVYCNSQLTVSIDSDNIFSNAKSQFQVDHYIPKSEYPAFSISLFNLYPVCASCNLSKKVKPINFELYSNDISKINKSNFYFNLEDGCVAKYKLSRNINDISIIFYEPSKTKYKKGEFQKNFDIEGIYNTQKDLVEELIIKSEIYDDAYKKTLIKSFSRIFSNASLSNRLIIGNYSNPDEIHKRPMSKFTQDIARQLELIK